MSPTECATENEDGNLILIIPEDIVEELGLTEGMEYEIEILDDGFTINPKKK